MPRLIRRALPVLGLLLALFLLAPALRSAAVVNLVSLQAVPLWDPARLTPGDTPCVPQGDPQALARLERWLTRAAPRHPHLPLQQGILACLQGGAARATAAWLDDADALPTALYAAIAAFPARITTAHGTALSDYAVARGNLALQDEQPQRAAAWYTFALSYAPAVGTGDKLARVYRQVGQEDRLPSLWEGIAQALPTTDPQHWQARARRAELDQDWATAAAAYVRAARLANAADAYALWLRAGSVWQRAGAFEPARAAFQEARRLEPTRIDAYLRLGDLARAQKAYPEAIDWYQRAQEVDPTNLWPAYNLGLVALTQQRYEEALAHFTHALALRPGHAGTLYYQAVTLDALGRRAEASAALAAAIEHHANPPQSWLDLLERWRRYPTRLADPNFWWAEGRAAERKKNYARAASLYRRGAQRALPPDDLRLRLREALMYRYLRDWATAEATYRAALARYPDSLAAYLGLGEVFRAQGAYDEATVWFQRARELAPEDPTPPYYLGLVAYARRDYPAALAHFRASLALKPDNAWVRYYEARTLWAMDWRAAAISALEHALASTASPPQSWRTLLQSWRDEVGR